MRRASQVAVPPAGVLGTRKKQKPVEGDGFGLPVLKTFRWMRYEKERGPRPPFFNSRMSDGKQTVFHGAAVVLVAAAEKSGVGFPNLFGGVLVVGHALAVEQLIKFT